MEAKLQEGPKKWDTDPVAQTLQNGQKQVKDIVGRTYNQVIPKIKKASKQLYKA